MKQTAAAQHRARRIANASRRALVSLLVASVTLAPFAHAAPGERLIAKSEADGAQVELYTSSAQTFVRFLRASTPIDVPFSLMVDGVNHSPGRSLHHELDTGGTVTLQRGEETLTFVFSNGLHATLDDDQVATFRRLVRDHAPKKAPSIKRNSLLPVLVLLVFGLLTAYGGYHGVSVIGVRLGYRDVASPLGPAGRGVQMVGGFAVALAGVAYFLMRTFNVV